MTQDAEHILLGEVLDLRARLSQHRATDAVHDELRRREQFTRSVLNSLSAEIAVIDQSCQILAVNEAWERRAQQRGVGSAGVGNSYLEACRQFTIDSPELASRLAAGIQSVARGERSAYALELPLQERAGTHWWMVRVTSLLNPTGGAVIAHQDITERRLADERLAASERHLRTVIDTVPECVKLIDAQGRLLEMNAAGLAMIGAESVDQLRGLVMADRLSDEHRREFQDLTRRVFEGESGAIGYEVVGPNDRRLWLESTMVPLRDGGGRVVACLGVTRDETERRCVDRELRESKAGLARVQRLAAMGSWVWDMASRNVWATDESRRILGLDPAAVDEPIEDPARLVHPDDREQITDLFRRFFHESQPQSWHCRILRPDGETRWVLCHTERINDDQGRPVRVVGALQDVSQLTRAENELRQAKDELERRVAERTAALSRANDELSREVAQRRGVEHALRSERRLLEQSLQAHERDRQLTAYEIHDGFVQYVVSAKMHLEAFHRQHARSADDLPELDEVTRLLAQAIGEGRRMISGLRPPIIDEQGIVAALEYLVSEQRVPGALEIEFQHTAHFDRLAPLLEGAIYRIVQEALYNVRRHSRSPRALVVLDHDDTHVRLEVHDWGVGFEPEKVVENRYGLQGIRHRVRILRGTVHIHSAPDQGTHVIVELPLMTSRPE